MPRAVEGTLLHGGHSFEQVPAIAMPRLVPILLCACLAITAGAAGAADHDTAARDTPCAAAYHADLVAIRAIAGRRIAAAIEAAREGDEHLKGKWLFPPPRRVARNLRDAHALAGKAVRTHGRDPWFRGDNATWLTRKLRNDLERYLEQPLRTGLCAPPGPMLAFLEEKLAQIKPRMGVVARAYKEALDAAHETSAIALVGLADSVTGAIAAAPAPDSSPRQAVASVLVARFRATMNLPAADGPERDALADLTASRKEIHAHPAMRRGTDLRKTLLPALQSLERAAYLERINAVYIEYHGAFRDTLDAIRIANRARCTCDR